MHSLVGEDGSCAATGSSSSTASSGARARADGAPLRPGDGVRVEAVDEDGLELVVAEPSDSAERT